MDKILAELKRMIQEAVKEQKKCMKENDQTGARYYEGVQDGMVNALLVIRRYENERSK